MECFRPINLIFVYLFSSSAAFLQQNENAIMASTAAINSAEEKTIGNSN